MHTTHFITQLIIIYFIICMSHNIFIIKCSYFIIEESNVATFGGLFRKISELHKTFSRIIIVILTRYIIKVR